MIRNTFSQFRAYWLSWRLSGAAYAGPTITNKN